MEIESTELGKIVRFSSHPRPFLVMDAYCDNPDCPCKTVTLGFTEVSDRGERVSNPLSFRARVDLETWQEESEHPRRSRQVADWVQEFLAECPVKERAEFKAAYKQQKWVARRLREYLIDPTDVVEGRLVSYADIITEEGALSGGGCGCSYRFFHKEREYLVEDTYCPNPDCRCEEVHVEFWECITREHEGSQRVTLQQCFGGMTNLLSE